MVKPDLPILPAGPLTGRRLVPSKFPPIALFDDVATPEEFDALYRVQALTNPRIQTELGNLELIPRQEIPFGIPGCSYATAPFTHVNPDGSRFSDGSFGMLYIADTTDTALHEVKHHQRRHWAGVHGLHFERFVFRDLKVTFSGEALVDACALSPNDAVYHPENYGASRAFGHALKVSQAPGLRYHSVRNPDGICWGLFTPSIVTAIIQTGHYEMVWSDGRITSVNRLEGY